MTSSIPVTDALFHRLAIISIDYSAAGREDEASAIDEAIERLKAKEEASPADAREILASVLPADKREMLLRGSPASYVGGITAGQALKAIEHALAITSPADEVERQDVMIGEFIARWEDAADGVMMDADTAQELARAFSRLRSQPSSKAIMGEIDKDPEITTDAAVRVYAAIKRAALSTNKGMRDDR